MAKGALTAQQINDRWSRGMAAASTQQNYKDGIDRYQGNPMAAAAAAVDKYAAGVQEAISSGRYVKGLNDASEADWRNNSKTVGAAALTTGATKAKAKHLRKMQTWAGIYQQASAAAQAASGTSGKIMASINTMRAGSGKSALS